MTESIFAGIALAVCLVLLVRLCLGWRRQERLDAALLRAWLLLKYKALRLYRWRSRGVRPLESMRNSIVRP